MSQGFIEIGFGTSEEITHPVLSMTPEVSDAIRRSGGDPFEYNRIAWPTGAHRFARGRFLMHQDDLIDLIGGDASDPLEFVFGPLTFDRMYIRNARPLLLSEGSRAVYSFDLVDERFYWQFNGVAQNWINLHTADKEKIYDDTEANPDDPYTALGAVNLILPSLGADPAEFDLSSMAAYQDAANDIRDIVSACLNAGHMIDKIFMSVGGILVAAPNPGYPGFGGENRYRFDGIDTGANRLEGILSDFTDDIIGGGTRPSPLSLSPPSSGAGQYAVSGDDFLKTEVPMQIAVVFPQAIEGGAGYSFSETGTPGVNWVIDRYWQILSSNGKPVSGDNGQTICVFDHFWAVRSHEGEIINLDTLTSRADFLALRYYGRFSSGACDLMLRGIQSIDIFSGAQEIIWQLDDDGPKTIVRGDFHDPLFGFSIETKMTPQDIFSTGSVRAVPRHDGGILIDALLPEGDATVIAGIILEVIPGADPGFNATYNIESCGAVIVQIDDVTPYDRSIPGVNYNQKDVGDNVVLFKCPLDDDYRVLAFETVETSACPSSQSQLTYNRITNMLGVV